MEAARTHGWLAEQLAHIWATYFPDVARVNDVTVRFVREGKTRLGWIALSESGRSTLIGINGLLALPDVPQYVCHVTIAHELVHYAHGFGSPLPCCFVDPHAGGVVERELEVRGLGALLQWSDEWSTRHWFSFYDDHRGTLRRRVRVPAGLVASNAPG